MITIAIIIYTLAALAVLPFLISFLVSVLMTEIIAQYQKSKPRLNENLRLADSLSLHGL